MNKNNGIMADLPIGDCEVRKNHKTFENKHRKVCLETKIEERSYGDMEILEKESTRIYKSKECISMLQVIVLVENGVRRKIVEYLQRKCDLAGTHVYRHKRITDQGNVIEDYVCSSTLQEEVAVPVVANLNRLHRVYK